MRESTLTLLQYISALILMVVAGLHLFANNAPHIGPLIHDNPLYPAMMVIFLTALLYHLLNGIRSILVEIIPGKYAAKSISWCLLLIGIAAYIYGLNTLSELFPKAIPHILPAP